MGDSSEYTSQYLLPSIVGFVYGVALFLYRSKKPFCQPMNIANSDVKPFRITEIVGTSRTEVAVGRNVPNPVCGCVLFGLLTVWPTEN